MIQIEKLDKSYGNKHVLKSITISFHQSQITSIIGPSGTGKTTLLRCIAGLEKPDFGHIWIDGEPLQFNTTELSQYRSKLGVVFQNYALFDHLTVLENVILALIKVKKVAKETAVTIAREKLKELGCLEIMNQYPHQLSGGQKQRVAIVRSLVMNPQYFIFDEPTSALDSDSIYQLIHQIKKLKAQGITILVITHDLLFAKRISDYLVMMNDGNVVEHKTNHDFFLNPNHEISKRFIQNQIGEIV